LTETGRLTETERLTETDHRTGANFGDGSVRLAATRTTASTRRNGQDGAGDTRAPVFQFLSRYPVLNIHPMMHRQAAKKAAVMPKLTPMFTSAVP
jgi:hypothetical protein